jgi:hypothetical protein
MANAFAPQIRINFYVTIFITAVVPRRPSTEKLIDALNVNAAITGFGLLITAILRTFHNRLDLYHAIFVSYMTYYLAFIVYFSGVLPRFRPVSSIDAMCRNIQMGARAQPAWASYSDNDCRCVPSLVDIYHGKRKDIWANPAVQLASPVHLLGSFHLRH